MPLVPWQSHLVHQLEELHLIRSSLLPGEKIAFLLPPEDHTAWSSLLDTFTDAGGLGDDGNDALIASLTLPPCQMRFQICVATAPISFQVELPPCTNATMPPGTPANAAASMSVKGDHISREVQERWHAEIIAQSAVIDDASAFPLYELLTLVIASLHQSQSDSGASELDPDPASTSRSVSVPSALAPPPPLVAPPEIPYHALLTSHHLISTTKRRSMHRWSSQLGITGFAKVGYPGVIYAQGSQDAVETFVRNIKDMQWLALRVRFVEPEHSSGSDSNCSTQDQSERKEKWVEVTKISQVLAQMRMWGKEDLVTNLGIGALSKGE